VIGDADAAERFLLTQPGVSHLDVEDHRLCFDYSGDDEAMSDLVARAVSAGLRVVEFARAEADLEDIFLRTTKGNLQ